jgi:DNA topoisomerase-1
MGYTLVICEKPDAARRVAYALSEGRSKSATVEGTTIHSFVRGGEEYVVCAAQGHVYGVSDPIGERTVYPVFDVEWYPSNVLDKDSERAGRCISAVKKLAEGASKLVNACDYDVEGETIGYNLLKYACGGKEAAALRAKFSTLTEDDLRAAFDKTERDSGQGLARAGRTRHVVDFVWGVNLSRALSQLALGSGMKFQTVSMGRVQGPTLRFLVEREREIRTFVPLPYWKVTGKFERAGTRVVAAYEEKVLTKAKAYGIRDSCRGKRGVVTAVRRHVSQIDPPPPFNIGDLQKEAYQSFGLLPSRTLQIAERLYLGALISYPRTDSQQLPPSLNLGRIIAGIAKMPEYAKTAQRVLASNIKPVRGTKSDPAHPAIHPTGERPKRPLERADASIFDLVVRRFLAAFGSPLRRELVDVTLAVGDNRFRFSGGMTLSPGWVDYYGGYVRLNEDELPRISEGDTFETRDVVVEEAFNQKPTRYNPGSLLEKMEKEGVGTKATRAEIIATLIERGYVSGGEMEVTELGFAVVEAMERFAPTIIGTGLTRNIEEKLRITETGGRGEATLLREMVRSVAQQLTELAGAEDALAKEFKWSAANMLGSSVVLGRCPVCRTGELRLIRSRVTNKRFAGCSNYPLACRASAPLPQRGTIRTTPRACEYCSWPIIYISGRGKPWRLCINSACPRKKT